MPKWGLAMKEGTILQWFKNEGDKIKGKIKSITDFGVFVGLEGDIDGLIHLSDVSWEDEEESIRKLEKNWAFLFIRSC